MEENEYNKIAEKIENALDNPNIKISAFFDQLESETPVMSYEFYRIEKRILNNFPTFIVVGGYKNQGNIIKFFKNRIRIVKTATGKAVYNDIVFLLTDDYEAALIAGTEYLNSIKKSISLKAFSRVTWLVRRVCLIGEQTKNKKLIHELCEMMKPAIKEIYLNEPLNVSSRLRESFIFVGHYLPRYFIEYFVDTTDKFFDTIEEKEAIHIERALESYLNFLRKLKLQKQLDHNNKRYLRMCRTIGDYYLNEADSDKSGFLASIYYQKGLRFATEHGYTNEIDSFKVSTSDASRAINWTEFTHSEKINIDEITKEFKKEAEKHFSEYEEPYLKYIASLHQIIPSFDQIQNNLDSQRSEGVGLVRSIIPTIVYSNDLPRGMFDSSSEEGKEYMIKTKIVEWTEIYEVFIDIILEDLIKQDLTAKRVYNFIARNIDLQEKSYPFLRNGLDLHFAKDYVGSIHVLLPQIERIIRNLILLKHPEAKTHIVGKFGIEMSEKMLGIINMEEAKGLFGNSLCHFISVNLVDPQHRNIRNRILHGLANFNECCSRVSTLLIWILLMISDVST